MELPPEKVKDIRYLREAEALSYSALAEHFDTTIPIIYDICNTESNIDSGNTTICVANDCRNLVSLIDDLGVEKNTLPMCSWCCQLVFMAGKR